MLVALLAEVVARNALPRHGLRARRAALAAVWIAFYVFYFAVMPD